MRKFVSLGFWLLAFSAGAYELKQINTSSEYIELVFNERPQLLNNSYLGTKNLLIIDFVPFTNKLDLNSLKHPEVNKLQLVADNKISRLLFKFKRKLTYRLEIQEKSLKLFLKAKASKASKAVPDKLSLRETFKMLAEQSGINLVISDKITGEAVLQIGNNTRPLDVLFALVEVNNLKIEQKDKLWLITLAKPEVAPDSKKPTIKVEQKLNAELIPLRYAKAADLAKTLKSTKNSLLSAKGSVSADERTNSLLINDTPDKIGEISRLVRKLDKPRKQVLIRSKIVIASDDFAKSLGVRFGISHYAKDGDIHTGISGTGSGAATAVGGEIPLQANRFNVNLPAANPTARIGLVIAKLPLGTMLDLELSASQLEGKTQIVASPHVMTADGATAYIQQGVEIPYRTETSDKIDVKFRDALMELRVTPRITPHNHIIMELIVKKDAVGSILCAECEPSIDTREVKTKVRIKNGETLVIGGISEDTNSRLRDSIPGINKIPLLGKLLSRRTKGRNKRELLVFITPKIIAN